MATGTRSQRRSGLIKPTRVRRPRIDRISYDVELEGWRPYYAFSANSLNDERRYSETAFLEIIGRLRDCD